MVGSKSPGDNCPGGISCAAIVRVVVVEAELFRGNDLVGGKLPDGIVLEEILWGQLSGAQLSRGIVIEPEESI